MNTQQIAANIRKAYNQKFYTKREAKNLIVDKIAYTEKDKSFLASIEPLLISFKTKKSQEPIVDEILRQEELQTKRVELRKTSDFIALLKTERRERLSNKLYKNWPYRTASMGNFFYVNEGAKEISLAAANAKVWPGNGATNVFGSGDTYSKSSNQSAIWVYYNLNLPGYNRYHFEVIGGLLTVYTGKLNRNVVTACIWFEQSKGMSVKAVEGYIYKGYHVKAKNAADAQKKIAKVRSEAAKNKVEYRAKNKISLLAKSLTLSTVWVTYDDSVKAGNCAAGTKGFAQRKGIDLNAVGAVRADWLINNANGSAVYVNRAIERAKLVNAERKINL